MGDYSIKEYAYGVRTAHDPWWAEMAIREGVGRDVWFRPGGLSVQDLYDVLGAEPLDLGAMFHRGAGEANNLLIEVADRIDAGLLDVSVIRDVIGLASRLIDESASDYQHAYNTVTGQNIGNPVKRGYVLHGAERWLIDTVLPAYERYAAEGLILGTAVNLGGGALSSVTLTLPETLKPACGFDFLPHYNINTSANQTIATQSLNSGTATVCDNTIRLSALLGKEIAKAKHTANSEERWERFAAATADYFLYADAMSKCIDRLAALHADASQFNATIEEWINRTTKAEPKKNADGTLSERSAKNLDTRKTAKREQLWEMYRNDRRVSPWKGTALGVFQAVNTYATHMAESRRVHRAVRNEENRIKGVDNDAIVLDIMGTTIPGVADLLVPVPALVGA